MKTQNDHTFIARIDLLIDGKWAIRNLRLLAYTKQFEDSVEYAYGNRDLPTCRKAWELLLKEVGELV